MPPLRDFLSRFRPAGSPGAGRAGVPADRQRQRELELAPVLALLADPAAGCAQLIAAAREDSSQLLDTARAQAAALAGDARRQAEAARAEQVRSLVAAASGQAAQVRAQGDAEAAAVSATARQRLQPLADRAVAMVRDLAGPASPPRGRPS